MIETYLHRSCVFLHERYARDPVNSGYSSDTFFGDAGTFQSLTIFTSPYCSQEIILDMFFELLNIKTPEWFKTFIDGRRLTSS